MIGNDIVDLRDPDSAPRRWQERFDRRVFAARERAWVECAADPQRTRWKLWSAKEAAYKAGRRIDPTLVFSPPSFEVSPDMDRVSHEDRDFEVEIRGDESHVHAIARAFGAGGAVPRVVSGVSRCGEEASLNLSDPSVAVRSFCRDELAHRLGLSADEILIERRGRIPEVQLPCGESLALSLSHHGAWIAFVCEGVER